MSSVYSESLKGMDPSLGKTALIETEIEMEECVGRDISV